MKKILYPPRKKVVLMCVYCTKLRKVKGTNVFSISLSFSHYKWSKKSKIGTYFRMAFEISLQKCFLCYGSYPVCDFGNCCLNHSLTPAPLSPPAGRWLSFGPLRPAGVWRQDHVRVPDRGRSADGRLRLRAGGQRRRHRSPIETANEGILLNATHRWVQYTL